MADDPLVAVAEACRHQIAKYGHEAGLSQSQLIDRVPAYRKLSKPDRAWVQVLLCKMPELSVTFGRGNATRFYVRSQGPQDAYNFGYERRPSLTSLLGGGPSSLLEDGKEKDKE